MQLKNTARNSRGGISDSVYTEWFALRQIIAADCRLYICRHPRHFL